MVLRIQDLGSGRPRTSHLLNAHLISSTVSEDKKTYGLATNHTVVVRIQRMLAKVTYRVPHK